MLHAKFYSFFLLLGFASGVIFLLLESNKDQHATAPCEESFHFASRPHKFVVLDIFWRHIQKKFLVSWHRPKMMMWCTVFLFFPAWSTKEHFTAIFDPTQADYSFIFCQCSDASKATSCHWQQLIFCFWKATKDNNHLLQENSSFFLPRAISCLMLHRLIVLWFFCQCSDVLLPEHQPPFFASGK